MRHMLIIFDKEISYAKKLAEYINARKDFPFTATYCCERNEFIKLLDRWNVELFLVEENLLKYISEYVDADRVILLYGAGKGNVAYDKGIYKYRRGTDILREILLRAANIEELRGLTVRKNKMQIIGFYSPVGRSLQTTLAIIMGKLMSKKYGTLYINLEGYSGLEELLKITFSMDMSDLMYELSTGSKGATAMLGANVRNIDGLDILPPMRNHKDLSSITLEEWKTFLELIEQNTEYEYVIMDMSESIQHLSEILLLCNKIYMTVENDNLARAKINQFYATLDEEYSKELQDKIIKCDAKSIAEMGEISIESVNGPLGDYCRKMIYDG